MRGKHANHATGPDHPRWSDEKMIADNGYVKIRVGKTHPLADPNGYAYEHEVVWASAGLFPPGPSEVHHHKNEVKTDNRIENLEIKARVEHSVEHNPGALPDYEVAAIRDAYQSGDHTGILAKRYGVPVQYVWKIVRGKTRRSAGGLIQELPLRVGKARAGRLLDGVEHSAMPLSSSRAQRGYPEAAPAKVGK